MSTGNTRKLVAAIAAVMQFIQEEEALAAPAVAITPPVPPEAPAFSPWRQAGRQDAMLFRTLWQRRLGRSC